MENFLRVLKPVTEGNTDETYRQIWLDQTINLAYGGYRRSWGGGDLLVKYNGPIEFDDLNYGLYDFERNEFSRNEHLRGKKVEGIYSLLTTDEVEGIFQSTYDNVHGLFSMRLNPKKVFSYIKETTMYDGVRDKTINIAPSFTINERGQFVAKVIRHQELGWVAVVGKENNEIFIRLQMDRNLIPEFSLINGAYYVINPVGYTNEGHFGYVLRIYKPGFRAAIQNFNSGAIMPNHPRYSVNPGEDGNDLSHHNTTEFPFIEGQNFENMDKAPMLVFQLDNLIRILLAMSDYPAIDILYKDSYTPVFIQGVGDIGYSVECVASPISQYRNGKVLTL